MQFEKILKEQVSTHPSMEPQDVVKLCYQAAFGAEHLMEDLEAAKKYFMQEYEQVQSDEEEPLYECIGKDYVRINLGAWKKRVLSSEWLFQMFVETAVHHSESYRRSEEPAYRLVRSGYMRLLSLLELISEKKIARGDIPEGNIVVAIDGRCASGKTTLSEQLAKVTGGSVIHMDDFFLPTELRKEERLREPGGNIHYERFLEEVIPFLKTGEDFSYRRFDCKKMELGQERKIQGSGIIVVEGAYSCHPKFGEYMTVRAFCDVEPEEQLCRVAARDGELYLETFRQRWIPMEETYFAAYSIKERADIVI